MNDNTIAFERNQKNPITKNLRTRLLKGISAQAFGQVVQIIIRLGEVPLFLGFWGAQRYGEWLMLAAIPAYLSMSDAGFTVTSCRDITMRSSAGNRKGALAVYQSTWVLLLLITLVIGSLTFIFIQLAPINRWLNISSISERETSIVFLIFVMHILLGFQGGLLTAGFWASGKYPQGMFFSSLIQLFEFAGMAVGLSLKGGPIQAATGYFSGRLFGTTLMWFIQRRISPWLYLGVRFASISEIKRLMIPSFAAMAFPLGSALNVQGIRMILGLALGPVAIAAFTPLRTIANMIVQPSAIIYRVTEPELALAYGSDNLKRFKFLYSKSLSLSFWMTLVVCVTTVSLTPWLFPLWTKGLVKFYWCAFLVLVLSVPVKNLGGTILQALIATNNHVHFGKLFLIPYGIIPIATGYFLAKYLGLAGISIAVLLGEVLILFISINEVRNILQITIHDLVEMIMSIKFSEILHEILHNIRFL